MGPGGDEKSDLASAIGEVDGDVAEISLEALTREMCERYECFFMSSLMLEQIALHLAVASGISVLVAETTEHLHGGVALLGGSVVVIDQNLINDRWKGPRTFANRLLTWGFGLGSGCFKTCRIVLRELVITGDLADGLAIPTSLRMAP